MKTKLIVVKQPIPNIIARGIYDEQPIKDKFTYLNFDDKNYFESREIEFFDIGTRVKYENKKYFIVGIKRTYWADGTVQYPSKFVGSRDLTMDDLDFTYFIAKSTTDREKDWIKMSGKYLTPLESYWFINSEGCVHEAYLGENPDTDEWRRASNNMFDSKHEAQLGKERIINIWENAIKTI